MYKDNSSAHVLGYVSQVSAKDLKNKKYLKEMSVPWYGSWENRIRA